MIEQYISDLLFKYDSVILPGFGSFVLKKFPASINPADNSLSPPSRHVVFDADSKNNDGILANHISEIEKISFFDACNKILAFVEEINKSFSIGNQFVFQKIGAFSKAADGSISFSPNLTVNYSLDSFGMKEIKFSPITITDNKPGADATPEIVPIVKKKKKFSKAAIWIIIIIVVLGGSIGSLLILKPDFIAINKFTDMFSSGENKNTSVVKEQPKEKNKSNKKENPKQSDSIKKQDTTKVNITNPISITEQPSTGNYFIISGSFRIKENADNYAKTLQSKSYNSSVIFLDDKGIYVVSYNSYPTESEAEQALDKIKTENPVAWILKH